MAEKELGCRLSTFWSKSGFGLYANSCSSCRGWGLLSWEEISSGPSETRLWLTITISGMSSAGNNDDTIEAVFIFFSNKRQDWDHFAGLSKTRFLFIVSSKGFSVKEIIGQTLRLSSRNFLDCCCEEGERLWQDKVEERKKYKKEKLQWNCLDTQRWKKKKTSSLYFVCALCDSLVQVYKCRMESSAKTVN